MRVLALLILGGCSPDASIEGPFSTPSMLAPGDPATQPEPDSFQQLFLDGEPPEISVALSEENAEALRLDPREYVDAEFSIEGEVHEVEVRLKGNGSFQPFDTKPSLKVKFEDSFAGVKTLILNNTTSDPSFASERLAARAYALAGVPAGQAGHAWVELDGSSRGLYTVLEDVDEPMLEAWFDDGSGSLYEMADGDFSAEFLVGIEHEEGPDASEDLQAVVDALDLGDAIGFDQATQVIDRAGFLRYTAVTAVVAQTDAYPYSWPGDDAYLYRDPGVGRFHFLPHGLDEAFQPRGRTLNYLNGRLARRCLANDTCRAELAVHIGEVFTLLEGSWNHEVVEVLDRLEAWDADPRQDWPVEGSYEERTAVYRDWLSTRRAQLETELQEL